MTNETQELFEIYDDLLSKHVERATKQGWIDANWNVKTGYLIPKEDRKFLRQTVLRHYIASRSSIKKSVRDCAGVKAFSAEAPSLPDIDDVKAKTALYLDKLVIDDKLGEVLLWDVKPNIAEKYRTNSTFEEHYSAEILHEYLDLRHMLPLAKADILELTLPPSIEQSISYAENRLIHREAAIENKNLDSLFKMVEEDRKNDNLKETIVKNYFESQEGKEGLLDLFNYNISYLKGFERTKESAGRIGDIMANFYIGKAAEALFKEAELGINLVAHSNAMWSALNARLGSLPRKMETDFKVFPALLGLNMSFLQNVKLEDILEIRVSEGDAFREWRRRMRQYVDYLSNEIPGTEGFSKGVERIRVEVESDFDSLSKEIHSFENRFRLFGIKAVASIAPIVVALCSSSPIAVIASILSGSVTIGWDLQSVLQLRETVRGNSLYFLWKTAEQNP